MRERLGVVAIAVVLVLAWAGGFLWFRGDLPFASDRARDRPAARPTPTPSVAVEGITQTKPKAGPAYTGTVTAAQERRPVDINPDPARPAPRALAPVASWTMATFNLLGSSHTRAKGDAPRFASGPARMNGALQILAQHQVTVAGLQEFQPDQRAAFASRARGWAMWPGLTMGRRAGENSVVWRTDVWEPVRTGLVPIPYFNGNIRPMPYVLLRHRQTGVIAWFSSFHNPADVRQFQRQQRYRTEATSREVALVRRLETFGAPVFVTGDMNERDEYFCRMTGETDLVAAAGGSRAGGCRPPRPIGIDWIFGSPQVRFQYFSDRSALVRRTTDHPVNYTRVVVDALKFRRGFMPRSPAATP